jgi:hypothetical protein
MRAIGRFFPCVLFILLTLPLSAFAGKTTQGNWLLDDAELPLQFGVGVDLFTIDQPYSINKLSFSIPGMMLPGFDTSAIRVQNKITHTDIKLDAWVLPYLNLFAILGKVNGSTSVDFTGAQIPLPVTSLNVDLDGIVYGAGATLAIGYDYFFGSVTTAYTYTDLNGDFDSSLNSLSVQPRAGIRTKAFELWLGGLFLWIDEEHNGTIPISLGGPFPIPVSFDVTLEDEQTFTPTLGGAYHFNENFILMVEAGFGDRETFHANLSYRF